MHQAITNMLEPYNCQSPADYKKALKEIVQQIVLLGLSRQKFFHKAAFYGGTALRIGHNLQRFSEDLDFTLIEPDNSFRLKQYLKGIEDELLSFELQFSTQYVDKRNSTPIDSAFLKGNTLAILMSISDRSIYSSGTHKNELIKIKLEIDTDPPSPSGENESIILEDPIPFSIRILKLESLFAGKLHAIICRNYPSGRVKGRDYYDFIWYMNKGVSPDLPFLEAKLKQSGTIGLNQTLTLHMVKKMIAEKVQEIDFLDAKNDVAKFIKDEFELHAWSTDFFNYLIDKL